jgi:hypothetical protein
MIEVRDRIAGPFFALNGIPATIADPELGAISVPQRPHGRGLPRTVRSEEAEHLAVANLERNIIKSDAIAEALGQLPDHQSGLTRRPIEGRGSADPFSATGHVSCRLRGHEHLAVLPQRIAEQ